MKVRRFACLIAGACLLSAASSGAAQSRIEGIALNRFEPADAGSEWFLLDGLDLRGHVRAQAGLVFDYARKPLVLKVDDEESALISDALVAHVGAALVAWDRLRFSLAAPVTLVQEGEQGETAAGMIAPSGGAAFGDLRIGADVRLFGEYDGPLTMAAGVRVFAPTGSRDAFTSDGAVRASLQAIAAGTIRPLVYSARLSLDFRARDDQFDGSPTGSEVRFAAAAGARLDRDRLTIGPEISGSTVVADGDAVFARRTSNVEILAGAHYLVADSVRLGAGIGPGLTRGFGTPEFRVLFSAAFVQPVEVKPPPEPPPPPPVDRDGDGIVDADDACPDEAGVATGDPVTHGCPPPSDRDGDGIVDTQDACPDEAGVATEDPQTHGCPPPGDRDGDGIVDPSDACPDEPGVATEDPATHGCPPVDRDSDGILNDVDACPDAAGPENPDPKKHGCPVARVEQGQIRIREQVQFATNSNRILNASDVVLGAVLEILQQHPEITDVLIQGHTDSRGSDKNNQRLSERRADAVMRWLVSHGIERKRLKAEGRGEAEPIDSNETEEGRANNRRVEFHIQEQAAPAPEATNAPSEPASDATRSE